MSCSKMTLRKGNENDVAGPGYFPLELHPKIMEYLRDATLGEIACVCRAWRQIAMRELAGRKVMPLVWAAGCNHVLLLRYLSPIGGGADVEGAFKRHSLGQLTDIPGDLR